MNETQWKRVEERLDKIEKIFLEHKPEALGGFRSIRQSIQFSPPEVMIHVVRMCEFLGEELGPPATSPDWARAIHDIWMSPNPA